MVRDEIVTEKQQEVCTRILDDDLNAQRQFMIGFVSETGKLWCPIAGLFDGEMLSQHIHDGLEARTRDTDQHVNISLGPRARYCRRSNVVLSTGSLSVSPEDPIPLLCSIFLAELLSDSPEVILQTLLHLVQDARGNGTVECFSNSPCDAGQSVAVTPK